MRRGSHEPHETANYANPASQKSRVRSNARKSAPANFRIFRTFADHWSQVAATTPPAALAESVARQGSVGEIRRVRFSGFSQLSWQSDRFGRRHPAGSAPTPVCRLSRGRPYFPKFPAVSRRKRARLENMERYTHDFPGKTHNSTCAKNFRRLAGKQKCWFSRGIERARAGMRWKIWNFWSGRRRNPLPLNNFERSTPGN